MPSVKSGLYGQAISSIAFTPYCFQNTVCVRGGGGSMRDTSRPFKFKLLETYCIDLTASTALNHWFTMKWMEFQDIIININFSCVQDPFYVFRPAASNAIQAITGVSIYSHYLLFELHSMSKTAKIIVFLRIINSSELWFWIRWRTILPEICVFYTPWITLLFIAQKCSFSILSNQTNSFVR